MSDHQSHDELPKSRHSNDFDTAVSIVRNELSDETANILRYSLQRQKEDDRPLGQTNLGIAMRNLLAKKGIIWEEVALYAVWFAILQKALETFLDS